MLLLLHPTQSLASLCSTSSGCTSPSYKQVVRKHTQQRPTPTCPSQVQLPAIYPQLLSSCPAPANNKSSYGSTSHCSWHRSCPPCISGTPSHHLPNSFCSWDSPEVGGGCAGSWAAPRPLLLVGACSSAVCPPTDSHNPHQLHQPQYTLHSASH